MLFTSIGLLFLSEEDILPNPLRILAEAEDVDTILIDSNLVQIQAEAEWHWWNMVAFNCFQFSK